MGWLVPIYTMLMPLLPIVLEPKSVDSNMPLPGQFTLLVRHKILNLLVFNDILTVILSHILIRGVLPFVG